MGEWESEEWKDAKRWKRKELSSRKSNSIWTHGTAQTLRRSSLIFMCMGGVDRIGNNREHRIRHPVTPNHHTTTTMRCAWNSLGRPCIHLSLPGHSWLGTKLLLEESDRSPFFSIKSCDFRATPCIYGISAYAFQRGIISSSTCSLTICIN